MSNLEMPSEFAGTIGIEWPEHNFSAAADQLPGWAVAFYDSTGYVTTIQSMVLHASVADAIWAELTMFADLDGKPVLHLQTGPQPGTAMQYLAVDGGVLTGTFPFLVISMRGRHLGPWHRIRRWARRNGLNDDR